MDRQHDRAQACRQCVRKPEAAPADRRQQRCDQQHQHDADGHVRTPGGHHEIPLLARDQLREHARDREDDSQEADPFDDARREQNKLVGRTGADQIAERDARPSHRPTPAQRQPADHETGADARHRAERRERRDDQPGEIKSERQVAADYRNRDDGLADLGGGDDAAAHEQQDLKLSRALRLMRGASIDRHCVCCKAAVAHGAISQQ